MMRSAGLLLWALLFSIAVSAQGFNFTCRKDTTISGCAAGCAVTLKAIIPDIYGQSNTYTINKISETNQCFNPYIAPNNIDANPTELAVDDRWGPIVNLGFNFVFFGSTYTQFVAGSNGEVTFDVSNANSPSGYTLPTDLPNITNYARASIMGPRHDIDISVTTSPNRKIQYQVLGTVPYRRWVLSFYKVPFYSAACHNLIENTHQIVLYESTGIVEVFVYSKQICPTWIGGKAMIGLQDWDGANAVMPPGRRASDPPWGTVNMNESWRFIPNTGASLFKRVELVHPTTNAIVATGTAVSLGNGTMEATFAGVCPPLGVTDYIVRPVYRKIDAPAFLNLEVSGRDTLRVNKTPGLLNVTTQTTASGCNPSGTINVSVTQPGTYTYTLDGGLPQASPLFTNVAAGVHNIFVSTPGGACTGTTQATVASPATLQGTYSSTAASCTGAANGAVTISTSNGIAPFEYKMGTGAWQTSNTFPALPAGNYNFLFKDASGCISDTIRAAVSDGPALQGTAAGNPTSCPGASNGSASLTATNGTAPLEYRLGNGAWQPANSFSGLVAGSYQLYFRDAAGCVSTPINATVDPGAALAGRASATPTSCFGASNGTASLQADNGTPPLEYRLGNGAWQSGNSFNGLAAGNYQLSFRDAAGCVSAFYNATVAEGTTLGASFTKSDVLCNGDNTGSATLTPAATGQSPFVFSLDSFVTTQAGPDFIGLVAGSYKLYYKDAAGCSGSRSVTIGQPAPLSAPAPVVQPVKCYGETSGSITLAPVGGVAPYSYAINGGTFSGNNNFAVPAGTHAITIRDGNNCLLALNNIVVTQPAAISATAPVIKDASCNGGADGSISLSGSGGVSPYRYSLTNGNFGSASTFNVNPGTYSGYITDANNCLYTLPDPINIGLNNDLYFTPLANQLICEGKSVLLQTNSNATSYQWKGPGITSNDPANAGVTVKPSSDTTYSVIASFGRCVAYDTLQVQVNAAPRADAGADNTVCYGMSDTLAAGPAAAYEWSPLNYLGGNTQSANPYVVSPSKTITYALHVIDANNCRSLVADSVTIFVTPPIKVVVSPVDTIGFIGDKIRLHAYSAGTRYSWSPIEGLDSANSANPLLTVTRDQVYRVRAWTDAGCAGEGEFLLKAYKGPEIYVPTAFTPNGDGLNDLLRPFPVGIEGLKYFRVYNRWGTVVYEYKGEQRGPVVYRMLSSRIGWDGSLGGKPVPTGSFIWVAEGYTRSGQQVFRKGVTTLIR